MGKCEISWIDPNTGADTGDDHDAIGVTYCEEYVFQRPDGTGVRIPESRCYGICLDHAMRLNDVAMHRWHFVPFPLYVDHEVTRDYTRDRLAQVAEKWLSSQSTVEAEVDWGTPMTGVSDLDPDADNTGHSHDDEDNDDTLPGGLPDMADPHDDETTTGDQDSDDY